MFNIYLCKLRTDEEAHRVYWLVDGERGYASYPDYCPEVVVRQLYKEGLDIGAFKEVGSWSYVAYAIGLHLLENGLSFDTEGIDEEYETRIRNLADEFYYNPELNNPKRPLMECLNEFLEQKSIKF